MKKILIIIMFLFILISSNIEINGLSIESTIAEINLDIDSKSGILIEPTTKSVIFEKNSNEKLEPASMTKIMTMLLVCEAIENNVLKLEQKLLTSEYAASMGGSQIFLEPNEEMSVNDLLKSVALASANDAAVVLAEGIAGSVESFVEMMNEKCSKLGLQNTHFVNPNGLPEDNHYSSSYDMGMIACELINNYGEFILKYTSQYEDYIRQGLENRFWLVNTNKLIRIDGIDGLKTGWTEKAGYCLTSTMFKNGIRMVSVIMGSESIDIRTKDTLTLLNYGVNNYEKVTLYHKGDVIEEINDVKYYPMNFNLVLDEDINIIKRKGEKIGFITIDKYIDINDLESKKNYINVYIDGNFIGKFGLDKDISVSEINIIILLYEILVEMFFAG